jgi:P27 family predicted phage terminase small subunit
VAAFSCYCQAVADFHAATVQLAKEKPTYIGPNGAICTHPAVRLSKDAASRIKQFASEFGLTPAARSRVPDPPVQEVDELEAYIRR